MRSEEAGAFEDEDAAYEDAARTLGDERGRNAGSWVIDGNTPDGTKRNILRMIEDGDPEWEIPAPLSGEWADGMTLGRLSDELGVDEESDEFGDLCTTYEDAYYAAYQAEVERSILASLPEVDG